MLGTPKRTDFVKALSDQHSITFSSIDTRDTGHELGSTDETCYFTEFWTHAAVCYLVSSVNGYAGVVFLRRWNVRG